MSTGRNRVVGGSLVFLSAVVLVCLVTTTNSLSAANGAETKTRTVFSLASQVKALLKALSSCKTSPDREPSGDKFKIGIVHDSNVTARALAETKQAFEENADFKVKNRQIAVIMLPFRHAKDLKRKIARLEIDAVFIPAGNDRSVRIILSVTRRLDRPSFTCVPDFVHWRGVTLGVDDSSGKQTLMVNLAGCRDEKVEFSKEVLDEAQVFF